MLGRLAKTIVVVFDGDTAGQRAAAKAIPLFVDAGILGGRIARLPSGVDPDDFVRQPDNGPDAFRRLVDGARPMLDQFIQDVAVGCQRSRPRHGPPDGRRAAGQGEGSDDP